MSSGSDSRLARKRRSTRCVLRRLSEHSIAVSGAAFGLLFVVLAILVGAGSLSRPDQWSVDHLMPGLTGATRSTSVLDSLFPIFDPGKEHGHLLVSALTYAIVWIASVIPASLLVALAIFSLHRHGKDTLAIGIGTAFVVADLIEIIGKSTITRPALHTRSGRTVVHVVPFDTSFPSGHEIRAVLLVVCLIACFPRLWPVGLGWLSAVTVMLVVGGWHTPSDVLGGLLVAVAVIGLARATTKASPIPFPPSP
jgi:membrane-associated phospholipid phosphatase